MLAELTLDNVSSFSSSSAVVAAAAAADGDDDVNLEATVSISVVNGHKVHCGTTYVVDSNSCILSIQIILSNMPARFAAVVFLTLDQFCVRDRPMPWFMALSEYKAPRLRHS